jgi:outer membrane protein assembly factor BamB
MFDRIFQREDIMLRSKIVLAVLLMSGIFVGWGLTQPQLIKEQEAKQKDAKEVREPKQPVEPDTFKDDIKIVQQAGLKGDGPELMEYLRKRTLKQPDPKEIAALVKQLGDEDFATREKAFTSLVTLGASAIAGLKDGESNPDLEVRKRVADLKQRIDTNALPMLHAAISRVLTKLKPDGTADVLMAYVPFVSEPMVVDEICKTLGAVALKNGKVEPVLLKGLTDTIAAKRGAAGEALVRARVKEEIPNVKKLLKDADVNVRYRVCVAMMPLQDRDLVPVMVDLLADMDPNQLWPIEEALLRLAGEKAPNMALGNDAASRKACRDVWAKWLTENEKNLDMTKLYQENIFLGYTLIVQQNNRIGGKGGNTGEVFELDGKKNVRWKIEINTYPVDAQMVGSNRVMVAEWQANRVTERDTKGAIKWEYNCGAPPFTVQRLPNGNTFVAMQGRLIEVDRNKTEVWSYQRPNQDIQRAKKLPNGEVAFVTNVGQYTRMDARTKNVIKQFNVAAPQLIFGNMDVLANGHVLITNYNQARVVEYNQDGGQVGNPINVALPNSVVRLPNGNNLITSYGQRQVYEFNGNQQVWNFQADGIVFVARRR